MVFGFVTKVEKMDYLENKGTVKEELLLY